MGNDRSKLRHLSRVRKHTQTTNDRTPSTIQHIFCLCMYWSRKWNIYGLKNLSCIMSLCRVLKTQQTTTNVRHPQHPHHPYSIQPHARPLANSGWFSMQKASYTNLNCFSWGQQLTTRTHALCAYFYTYTTFWSLACNCVMTDFTSFESSVALSPLCVLPSCMLPSSLSFKSMNLRSGLPLCGVSDARKIII